MPGLLGQLPVAQGQVINQIINLGILVLGADPRSVYLIILSPLDMGSIKNLLPKLRIILPQ